MQLAVELWFHESNAAALKRVSVRTYTLRGLSPGLSRGRQVTFDFMHTAEVYVAVHVALLAITLVPAPESDTAGCLPSTLGCGTGVFSVCDRVCPQHT